VILMFVLFFLFRDRDGGLRAVRRLLPLSDREASRMFSRIREYDSSHRERISAVGLVQAIMAGIMYVALGVPAAVIWAAITFLAALVPMFGTALVWAPIALYLALTGSMIKAAILVGWAALAVGTIDNLLYPYLVGDQMRVHTVPTFFSILGGISVFGGAGLILGPLTLAITLGLLDVWWWRTADGKDARHPEISKAEKNCPERSLGRGRGALANRGHPLPRRRPISRRSRLDGLPSRSPSTRGIILRSSINFSRNSRLALVSR
jgi:predicted PurR-regulated permease PerM